MLQEEQTVTFQPMYESYQPWFAKLFVFYLLIVLIVLLSRGAKFIVIMLKLLKRNDRSASLLNEADARCAGRMASSKQLAGLTVLISILNLSWWTADIMLGVRTAKTPNLAYILPAIGDALTAFTFGMIVAVATLCGSIFAQFVVNRRRPALTAQK